LTGLARMSTAELAIKHLGRALTALDEMLTRAPDDVDGRYEKGRALHELAKLEVAASKRSQAARIARNASREFARARELAPSDVRIARAEEELQKTLTESDSSSRVTSHR